MTTITTRMEVSSKKGKIYIQFYVQDTDILLRTYIIKKEDTLQLDGIEWKMQKSEVFDYS